MNKKIFSIFSISILIGVIFVAPVEAREPYDQEKEIIEAMNNYSKRLSQDSDFQLLLELHNKSEIAEIFQNVFKAQSEEEMNQLAQEYINIIDTEKLKDVLEKLDEKYSEEFNSILQKVNDLYSSYKNSGINTERYYYIITEDENGIKIIKQETEKASDDAIIVRGKDGAIKICDGNWITQIDIDKLIDFLMKLAFAGIIVLYGGMYIVMIGMVLEELGLKIIGKMVFTFGMRLSILGLGISMGSYVLAMVFDVLSKVFEKNKTLEKTQETLLQRMFQKILLLFQKITIKNNPSKIKTLQR